MPFRTTDDDRPDEGAHRQELRVLLQSSITDLPPIYRSVFILRAVEELQSSGVCADCTVTVVDGPDEYLFGEEKAMLEVIEGKPPLPRVLPPVRAHSHGTSCRPDSCPTLPRAGSSTSSWCAWRTARSTTTSVGCRAPTASRPGCTIRTTTARCIRRTI